jgi:hypothetical protein
MVGTLKEIVMLQEQLCDERLCLIVGSAPSVMRDLAKLTSTLTGDELIIGANGGAAIAHDVLGMCHVLCTTSHLFQQRLPIERSTVELVKDLPFDSVWIDVKSGSNIHEFNSPNVVEVVEEDRANIVYKASGTNHWVSTGVFALCLAKVSGASRLTAVGFSHRSGHFAIKDEDDTLRMHVDADKQVGDIVLKGLFDNDV